MKRLIPVLASALSACGQLHPPDGQTCIDAPCVATINLPADIEGTPDTRPQTWGLAGSREVPYTFAKVPAGYRVRVLRIDGDMVSWPHGDVTTGKFAGVLWGATTTSSAGDVHLDYASQGCLIYIQDAVGADRARAAFDRDTSANGLLDADNVLHVKIAVFLNELAAPVHVEVTANVTFQFVRP